MILVIAEKPSVAQTIAAVLGAKEKKDGFLTGSGYLVSWCVGHLVGLAEAATYGEQYKKWSYDSLPILPQEWKYTVSADKEKQFKTLKELMHRADVSEVVNACDAGREGELIFRFVYEMAGCKKPMRRLWISSMEDSAIKEGFSRLKNGEEYDALFASALCRAKADWLIGINATRLFSVLYNHTLISCWKLRHAIRKYYVWRNRRISAQVHGVLCWISSHQWRKPMLVMKNIVQCWNNRHGLA